MAPHFEKLPVPPTKLGEGPHWDSERQTLYFVSLTGKTLHRYVPATKEHAMTKLDVEFTPSFIIPVLGSPELFAVNLGHKVHILRWDGQTDSEVTFEHTLAELDLGNPTNIINDGKIDPRGRLYTGTIGLKAEISQPIKPSDFIPTGSMYSVTADGLVRTHDTGISCSNGLVFDVPRKALYHVDSFAFNVNKHDYDVETGETANKSVLFNYKENNVAGYPDGMTTDRDGNLWVASYEGANVVQINPDTGKVIQILEIPDKLVTSVTFGGPNLDVLYVTTGYDDNNPHGGGTFAVTGLGVRGYENLPFEFKVLKK